jgi:Spy/CpxP family protein refolding chaperone
VPRFIIAALPLSLLLLACDNSPADELGEAARIADTDASSVAGEAEPGPHGHDGARHGGGADKLDRLCGLVACTDAQRQQLTELVAANPKPERGDKSAMKSANAALATAFRGDAFARGDIDAYQAAADAAHPSDPSHLIALATGAHAILTPEQRTQLGAMIEKRGLPFGGTRGHGREGRRGHGPDGEAGEAGKTRGVARKVDRVCEALACTDAQKPRVQAALEKLGDARPPAESHDAANAALGQAFASSGFGDADVEAYLTAQRAGHVSKSEGIAALALELHAILDADQRGTIADRVEHHGLRAIAGGKDKRGRKGKGKRRRHPRRPRGEAGSADGERGLG